MSLHKLTAGDGYTYLTRQVAAADATHRGRGGLGEYYSQRGESPGVWMGHGAAGLTEFLAPTEAAAAAAGDRAAGAGGAFRGGAVSETQMLALFGEGRHPNAEAIEKAMITGGQGVRAVLSATRLGVPYQVVKGPSAFRVELARRFEHTNSGAGLPRDWPVPEAERAAIRTALGREMFTGQYGRAPSNSRELSGFLARAMRQQTTAVAGYDLTFTPVKSVSALWALAPRDVAQVIEGAHQAAVEQCLSWLEDNAAYTRLGRGGARQVDVRGLIAAAFTHRDSRAGDPNLHTHVAVSNKVQAVGGQADGRWLALDGRPLHKLAVAASERYNTRLEALLRDRLGVEFTERATEPGKRAVREIVGVDERLLKTWSARRLMIDVRRGELAGQFQARHGRPPGPIEAVKLAQQATLETRQAKHQPRSHAEQRRTWRAEALGVLGTPQALAAMVDGALQGLRERGSQRHDRPQTSIGAVRTLDTPGWVAGAAEQVLTTVQTSRATWQQAHVRAEAERAVRTANLPVARVDAAVEAIVAGVLSPARSLPLGMPEPVSEPAALRRRDGTSVYTTAGAQLFTSPRVVAAEQALLALSMRTGGRTVSAESIELALLEAAASGVVLNPGQVAMVRGFTGSALLMQLALAPAGTGKTVTMSVVSRAWKGDGGSVIGLAPSAAAAAILGQELSGAAPGSVHSDTLAKLIFSLDTLDQQAGRAPGSAGPRGPVPAWVQQIGPGTLVILDEAGMAGTVELARAAQWITDRGAVLRLVGDDAQLAAVGAGGVLRDIAETAGALTLSAVVRFTDPAEGAASLALRAGERAAIGFYIDNDRVHVGDPATGVDAAYHAWTLDRQGGLDALMLAPTRAVAAELNARARADRLATGNPDGTRGDAEVRLSGGSAASAGDTVVTRRNNRRLALSTSDWVKNGDRWTVRDVLPGGAVTVQHHHTRRVITLPATYASQHLALGYASTVHAAQGVTADTCHTVATGAEDRQLLYVAMTRGRTCNHLYLSTAGDGDEHSVLTPDALLPPTAVDLLTRILDRDGAQLSATTAQAQLADPAVRLGAAADRYHDSLHAAALHQLGKAGLAALDRAAEQTLPGLTDAPAWTTLRASLALHAATDTRHDPSPDPSVDQSPDGATVRQLLAVQAAARVLHRALRRGEVRSAADPAAVLDWRLDLSDPNRPRPTRALTGTARTPGPLAWLPAIPAGLENDVTWGSYLQARHGYTTYLAEQVAQRARTWTPTSAPAWAAPLLGADSAGDLLADLAVWRAANHVADNDLTPTGPSRLPAPDAREQNALGARALRALGDPAAAAHRWRTLAQQLEPRLLADPYWPVLADRLAAAARAGIDVDALVRHAFTANPSPDSTLTDGPAPLPDEMPAAALWWRLSRQLAPAALLAQTSDLGAGSTGVPPTLRPAWTGHLTVLFGDDLGARVVADPAWPALVAAVTQAVQAGWTPEQVLTTTHELLYDTHPDAHPDAHHGATSAVGDSTGGSEGAPTAPRAAELATALVWRVAMLTHPPEGADQLAGRADTPRDDDLPVEVEYAPLDPYEQDMLPPEDLYDGLDESPDGHSAVDLPDDRLSHPGAQHPPAELDEDPTEGLAQHRQAEPDPPDWPALAPAHDQAAGQEQLWQAASGSDAEREAGSAVTAPVAKERLLELNAQAAGFYAGAYRGSWAQQHLQQRLGTDLTGDPRFTPGYAPAGWTHLVEHLRARGATDPELLQAGLATRARTGRLIDWFRDRLVLPIHTRPSQTLPSQTLPSAAAPAADPAGGPPPGQVPRQVIGFVGRRHPDAVDDHDGYCPAGPKYLNTADSLVFSKGAQLYGLAEAAAALAAGAVPVLVEGPLDALAVTLAAGGDAVGVAPLGTAFTDLQADSLRPYLPGQPADPTGTTQTMQAARQAAQDPRPRPGVIVGTDADNAGRTAATAAYWKLVARGANPGHLTLPDGLDPAELLSTAGPQALRAAIAAARAGDSTLARTVVTDRVAGYADQLHTAEGTVHAIRAAAKVIGALPPEHWAAHIAHLDTLVDAAAGLTGLEVLDAALARTDAPHHRHAAARRAPHRAAGIVPEAPGSRPAAPQPSDKALAYPTYLADAAPTPARTSVAARDSAGGPATQVAADGPTERITAQWAAQRWRDVGLALDPRLVAGRDWPRLALTLELASRTGYNVQEHLPRLAALEPLPDEQPASALRSRLLREVPQARTTATPQVRRAADRQRIADAAAAHAGNNDDPARRQAGASAPGRGPAR